MSHQPPVHSHMTTLTNQVAVFSRDKRESEVVASGNPRYSDAQREEGKGHDEVIHVALMAGQENHRHSSLHIYIYQYMKRERGKVEQIASVYMFFQRWWFANRSVSVQGL